MVTLNLPHNNVTMVARLMYSLGLLCSYPLQVMPAFEISEKTGCFEKLPNNFKYPRLKSIVFRCCIVLFTGVFSIMIPRFGLFLNFSGAFSMTFLAFIMPVSIPNKTPVDPAVQQGVPRQDREVQDAMPHDPDSVWDFLRDPERMVLGRRAHSGFQRGLIIII